MIRAHATLSILSRLGYVDLRRVAAHGHSMGAFVTTAFAATHGDFLGASDPPAASAPTASRRRRARARAGRPDPAAVQRHHGGEDDVVPLAMDQLFEAALDASGVPHEGHVYAGESHDIARIPRCWAGSAWYAAHGMF